MKVSIVIPVYNVAQYLTRCLDSVGRQTFRDFEVVAVDDGSTDGSGEILDAYAANFPLRRIHQANGGASRARNVGLAAVLGEYVMFVDADDIVHPHLLEWAVEAIGDHDYVAYDYRTVPLDAADALVGEWQADGNVRPEAVSLTVPGFDWFVGARRVPGPCQFLFRRETLESAPFATDIAIYEDVPFVLGYLARKLRGTWLRRQLYGYVTMKVSQSHHSPFEKRMAGVEAGMRLLRGKLDDRQWRLHVRNNCSHWIVDLWREVRSCPPGNERTCLSRALASLVSRLRADGLIRWRDFKLSRRLRLMAFLALCRREAK